MDKLIEGKDFTYYSKFGWTEENNLPYVWPTKDK